MGYVGSRTRQLEDPQAASAVGHFAGGEGAPRPALDVRGPLAGRHAVWVRSTQAPAWLPITTSLVTS
jgi:hypothetical protein